MIDRGPQGFHALKHTITGTILRRILRQLPKRHVYFFQVYAGFLSVLIAFAALVVFMIWSFTDKTSVNANERLMVLAEKLLPADATQSARLEALEALASVTSGNLALFAPDGREIARVGKISSEVIQALTPQKTCNSAPFASYWNPVPCAVKATQGLPFTPGPFNTNTFHDGRKLVIDWSSQRSHIRPHGILAVVALITALGAYPIARRLSRRVETLQQQARAMGQGKLSVRVAVKGDDEIAELARGFNQAAQRVESLVSNQRAMLASASHELRSPLARIRMACSLFGNERPELQAQIARDIAELDALIGDLLLASSLSGEAPPMKRQTIDLLGLAAEEASRIGAKLVGQPTELQGDARLLRHLVRNLLENSRRHAAGSDIEIEIDRSIDDFVILRVQDRGPGVPEDEKEKIFEPFYRSPHTAETGEGVGYGLALVRRIAHLHHGEACCLARPGGGACFEIWLPY